MCGGVRYNNLSPATDAAAAVHDDNQKIHNRWIHDNGEDGDDLLLLIPPPPCPAPKSCSPVGLSIIVVDPPSEEDENRSVGHHEASSLAGALRRPSLTDDVLTRDKLVAVVGMSMAPQGAAASSYAPPAGAPHTQDMADQAKAPPAGIGGGGAGAGAGAGRPAGVGRHGGRPVIGDGGRARRHSHGHEGGAAARCRSIFFTAASPPPPPIAFPRPMARSHSLPASFGECFWCTRPLTPHTDLYMYRGDRAFCSSECRYKQMDVDEQNERQTVNITWKHDQSSNNNKVNYHATTVEIVG